MNLQCRGELAASYKSRSQIARVVSEDWCARELFCPACSNDRLSRARNNAEAIDFSCDCCKERFQVKSGSRWSERRVPDAAYDAMIRAIRSDRTPNLYVLQYAPSWTISNLLLVPRFFFSETAIEKRKPLAVSARRAGWVGCNILLSNIAEDGKIRIVSDGAARSKKSVREHYDRLRPLSTLPPSIRGWTLDVLNVVRRLKRREFNLADVYAFETELQNVHPSNRNVRPKIRQQLQVLRDLGLLSFAGQGHYLVRE
jgi:type II restriction enzyme